MGPLAIEVPVNHGAVEVLRGQGQPVQVVLLALARAVEGVVAELDEVVRYTRAQRGRDDLCGLAAREAGDLEARVRALEARVGRGGDNERMS
jgi:hypothetical protein